MAKKNTAADSGKPRLLFAGSVLRKALSFIGGVISTNPVYPVLENVKVYALDGVVTFTGTDMQTTASINVPAECIKVNPNGELFLLPHALLSSLVSSLNNDIVSIEIDNETYGHTLTCKYGIYKLPGENPLDFPRGEDKGTGPKGPIKFTLSAEDRNALIKGLNTTVFAVGQDHLRQAMTGVNLKADSESLVLAATNGYILAKYPTKLIAAIDSLNIILFAKFVRQLIKLNADADPALSMDVLVTGSSILIVLGDYTLKGLLIDERYPDYENAIPTNQPIELKANKAELVAMLKRVMLFANKTTHQVRLTLTDNNLRVSAEDLDYSREGTESIDVEYEGELFEIGFNAKNFLECVSHTEGDTIRLTLSAPNRAGLIYGEGNPDALMLTMPVMLNTYA